MVLCATTICSEKPILFGGKHDVIDDGDDTRVQVKSFEPKSIFSIGGGGWDTNKNINAYRYVRGRINRINSYRLCATGFIDENKMKKSVCVFINWVFARSSASRLIVSDRMRIYKIVKKYS